MKSVVGKSMSLQSPLPLGLEKWMTVSSWKMLTSSIPGMVLTPSLLRVFCRRLSSVVVVLWTAFFFLWRTAVWGYEQPASCAPPHCALAARAHSARHLHQPLAVHLWVHTLWDAAGDAQPYRGCCSHKRIIRSNRNYLGAHACVYGHKGAATRRMMQCVRRACHGVPQTILHLGQKKAQPSCASDAMGPRMIVQLLENECRRSCSRWSSPD